MVGGKTIISEEVFKRFSKTAMSKVEMLQLLQRM